MQPPQAGEHEMTKYLTTLATGLILASGASAAANKGAADNAKQGLSAVKYCIQYDVETGSHINKTECKTKAEWAELGIDVDALSRKK
jgi:hypothetical protein